MSNEVTVKGEVVNGVLLHTPVIERSIQGGSQRIYRFANGYGASVVNHSFSYGTELAVLLFTGPDNLQFNLNYNTPITDDVIGHLSEDEVEVLLDQINALPPASELPPPDVIMIEND